MLAGAHQRPVRLRKRRRIALQRGGERLPREHLGAYRRQDVPGGFAMRLVDQRIEALLYREPGLQQHGEAPREQRELARAEAHA
jgi:hypothetical protein